MSLLTSKCPFFKFFLILFGWFCLVGCQYQFGHGELSQRYTTISVPYVEGDQKGELTTEIIRQLSTSGAFRYVNTGGDLILKVKFLELRDENIDFRYDRKKKGELKNSIIPTETRFTALVEVLIVESGTGEIIRGPTRVTASTEFDHTYYTTRDKINIFSLGQLSDIDVARDAAMHPLNRHLAERVVDYVMNSW
jgi:hypothetical protein